MLIQAIQLPVPGIEELQAEAHIEGYRFIDTLVNQWLSGENRFNAPGEALCGCMDDGLLIAVGGLTRDPFLSDPAVGRIRRVYVRRACRNRGIGAALLDQLLSVARQNFSSVRLRAESPQAARLYGRKGFSEIQSPTATHILHLRLH
jgi:GNAT superfamily N-acetyltransferase